MAVRFLPDASGFDLSQARTRVQIEGAGQQWAAWLRNATITPSVFIQNENGEFQEVQITEPVVVKTPFKSIELSNIGGLGTLRMAVTNNVCDDLSLGGVAGVADVDPITIQASAHEILGTVVGNYSIIELWNPEGSGFNLFIDEYVMELSGSMSIEIRTDTAQNGISSGDTTRIEPIFTDQRNPNTPVAEIGIIANALKQGTEITRTQVGINFVSTPPHAIVITPGNSCLFHGSLTNRGVRATPLWREIGV